MDVEGGGGDTEGSLNRAGCGAGLKVEAAGPTAGLDDENGVEVSGGVGAKGGGGG